MPPPQQVVDISVVMLSSLAPEQTEAATAATVESVQPLAPEKLTALQIPATPSKQVLKKTETKHEKSIASTPPTTGPQAPKATIKVAAITKPIFNAASLHNTPPAYPDEARRRGIEGTVTLEVDVTAQGAAQEVTVTNSSGYALLDRAAHDAIRNWHFIPAHRGDEIVEARVMVPVEFRLD